MARAKYVFPLSSLLYFVRSVHSSFVHCALCIFLTRSVFVYRAFIYQAFCIQNCCAFIIHCVPVLRSFSVYSFTVCSSVRLHVRSAFVLCLCTNESKWNRNILMIASLLSNDNSAPMFCQDNPNIHHPGQFCLFQF